MALTERRELQEQPEPDKIETALPSPESMMVQKWFGAIDDVAIEFAETLAERDGKPEKAGDYLARKFDGFDYRWSFTNTTQVAGSNVDATIELILRPDHLLRGTEAFIGGFTQVSMVEPVSGKPFGAGGPELLGLQGSLDASPRKRTQILGQIREYLPQAREAGNRIAQELPAAAKARMQR